MSECLAMFPSRVFYKLLLFISVMVFGSACYSKDLFKCSLGDFCLALERCDSSEMLALLNQAKEERSYSENFGGAFSVLFYDKSSGGVCELGDLVRISSADFIAQAWRNGFHVQSPIVDYIREYSNKMLYGNDDNVKKYAVFVVSYYDEEDGFDRILGVSTSGGVGLFRSSMIALSGMCKSFDYNKFNVFASSISDDLGGEAVKISTEYREFLCP